jgi:hypothetical protein
MTALAIPRTRPGKRALALAGTATLLALLVGSSAALAQEPTPTSTPGEAATILRVEAPPGPISEGERFEVQLVVENVEHLAALDINIDYDSEQLRLVSGQMEPFFLEGEREPQCADSPNGWVELSGSVSQIETKLNTIQGAVVQSDPEEGTVTAWFPASETDKALQAGKVERTRVFINCFSLGGLPSTGGPPGVSGSGTLATMTFESIGDGVAELQLSDTQLLLDDVDPPGDPEGQIVSIPHETESASVKLEGGTGGSSPWLIIGVAAGVAVALVVVGGAVLLRRGGGSRPPGPDSQIEA